MRLAQRASVLYTANTMIIGILGRIASGKDTAATHLQSKGFAHISLSALLREEATKRGIEWTRENLMKLGTDLKSEKGGDALARIASEQINGDTIITSIRHPYEVRFFIKKYPDFRLISIEADIHTRYARACARKRAGDTTQSFDEFKDIEQREEHSDGGQNVHAVFAFPHIEIDNNGTIDALKERIDATIVQLKEDHGHA